MDVLKRNNVSVTGQGAHSIVFAHGFGLDQTAWDAVSPAFEAKYRVIRFDHVGAGHSDAKAYDSERYSSLNAYAADLIEILDALDLYNVIFVGHSVGAMIGMLGAIAAPDRIASLVMVCPSPHYMDEPGYVGGFSRSDLDELLEMVDSNFLGWSRQAAPAIMANPERPELGEALGNSFCQTDPTIAREFARVTFMSDHRADLHKCTAPTLILQTRSDMIAPEEVGRFMADKMPDAEFILMAATGHCPHISALKETIAAIQRAAPL